MSTRLLLLTTAQNEARFADALVNGVLSQTRLPDRWVIVDDGSTDGTFEALSRRVAGRDWITLLRRVPPDRPAADRLAAAAVPKALNWALAHIDWRAYTHIGKLDADAELPPCFVDRLLGDFRADRSLGMTGGVLIEPHGRGWRESRAPATHAPPVARVYSRDCFEVAGGFRERLAWDTVDEVYARMNGFRTTHNESVRVRHLRALGTADGRLRGHARHGACAWILHYPTWFASLRALKIGLSIRPIGVTGAAFLAGFLASAARRAPQVDDPAFRDFVRRDLRARLATAIHARGNGLRADRCDGETAAPSESAPS